MSKLILTVAGALATSFALADAAIDSVQVWQDWPWSRNVNVKVVVSGAGEAGVDIRLTAMNGSEVIGEIAPAKFASGSPFAVGNGTHVFAFDPQVALPESGSSSYGNFKISAEIVGTGDPYIDREEYLVFDLVTGTKTLLTRRDFYADPDTWGAYTKDYSTVGSGFVSSLGANETFVWTGVNSNETYKTTKLAMKRIHAADKVWYMGPSDDDTLAVTSGTYVETRFQVKLTKDFYIGVFELTQRQYETIMGNNPSYFTNVTYYAHPLEHIGMRELTGTDGFCKTASTKCGVTFTLPTEAQWEFAAKAGYDGPNFPNGKERTADNALELEGYKDSRGHTDRNVSNSGHYVVGVGRPNAYGLFNTLGNVMEKTRENVRKNLLSYYTDTRHLTQPFVDPINTNGSEVGGDALVYKGGNFNRSPVATEHRPSYREGNIPSRTSNGSGCPGVYGYRLSIDL